MPSPEWIAAYSVGHELIDDQHRGLLGLISRLEDLQEKSSRQGMELEVLTDLVRYANIHFRTEEELMEQADYPGRWEHEKSHLEFRAELARLAGAIMQEQDGSWADLMEFIHTWWEEHIQGSDREVFRYLNRHQALQESST